MGVAESKTSPRHLTFLKQLKKTTEMMLLLRVLFLDTPGHPTSAPQYSNTNSSKYVPYMHITIINLGIASVLGFFFSSPRGGHGRRKILLDSHPYSHETSIFTLVAPHEEVQGRQTKLHPGFTMGKLVQPSPGISFL